MMVPKEKFLSLKTTANNIGEEIQILAASRFYSHVSHYINKERLNMYNFDSSVYKLIINGWFMRNYKRFYLVDNKIIPLLISLHISPNISDKFFKCKKNIEFLKKYSPVGCRDTYTMTKMQKYGIESYYSGCLTLTLQRNNNLEKLDYILLIDCPKEIELHIKKISNKKIVKINPILTSRNSFEERMDIAKLYLKCIQQASLVISTMLHAVLPALALETKCVFIYTGDNTQNERCQDISDLLPYLSLENFFKKYKTSKDLENINISEKYLQLREQLIYKCSEFTGFNSIESVIPNTSNVEDLELFFNLTACSKYKNNKVLFNIPVKSLIKNIYTRCFLRKNDDDIY